MKLLYLRPAKHWTWTRDTRLHVTLLLSNSWFFCNPHCISSVLSKRWRGNQIVKSSGAESSIGFEARSRSTISLAPSQPAKECFFRAQSQRRIPIRDWTHPLLIHILLQLRLLLLIRIFQLKAKMKWRLLICHLLQDNAFQQYSLMPRTIL